MLGRITSILHEKKEKSVDNKPDYYTLYSSEIFHITPTRATIVGKCTKYVKYAGCLPLGNNSFICGTHEQNHQIKDELGGKNHFIFSVFAYKYYQLKTMNNRKLAVQCLFLVATVAFKFIQDAFYFTHHFHSLATHLHVGLLRCPLSLPGALFLRFVLFWLGRCGVGFPWEISIGIGA